MSERERVISAARVWFYAHRALDQQLDDDAVSAGAQFEAQLLAFGQSVDALRDAVADLERREKEQPT